MALGVSVAAENNKLVSLPQSVLDADHPDNFLPDVQVHGALQEVGYVTFKPTNEDGQYIDVVGPNRKKPRQAMGTLTIETGPTLIRYKFLWKLVGDLIKLWVKNGWNMGKQGTHYSKKRSLLDYILENRTRLETGTVREHYKNTFVVESDTDAMYFIDQR